MRSEYILVLIVCVCVCVCLCVLCVSKQRTKKNNSIYPGGVAIENGVCLYDSQTHKEKKLFFSVTI